MIIDEIFECPGCGAPVIVSRRDHTVEHAVPICATFQQFIREYPPDDIRLSEREVPPWIYKGKNGDLE